MPATARVAGVNLAVNKHAEIALTAIYGVGRVTAQNICKAVNISGSTKIKDLTEEDMDRIRNEISDNYTTEGDLRRVYSQNIKRLTEIGSAAGRRHRVGLPVRGQRTRTNARTRKGKVKVVVAKKSR